jgi:hypothetical protein
MDFEQILAAAKQLPPDEQQKLIESLQKPIESPPKKKLGRRVPPPVPSKDRTLEYQWLAEHSREFAGKWVALEGDQMIACGARGAKVLAEARAKGVDRPFLVQVLDPDGLPFAGAGV